MTETDPDATDGQGDRRHSNGPLGFPSAATRNTTRISGTDPVDISMAAALAAYPTTGPGVLPAADGCRRKRLAVRRRRRHPPARRPSALRFCSHPGTLSATGVETLAQLNPPAPDTGENKVFTVGKVARPRITTWKGIDGADSAGIAAVAEQKAELTDGPPAAFVVVSSESPTPLRPHRQPGPVT